MNIFKYLSNLFTTSKSKERCCFIYKTKREFIIVTKSKTKNWIWRDSEPIYRVQDENKSQELIKTVYKSLDRSKTGVRDVPVESLHKLEKENLKMMGQKSYVTLYRNSNSCRVNMSKNGDIKITPYKLREKNKYTQGLEEVHEDVVEVSNDIDYIDFEHILIKVLDKDYKNI